MLRIWLAEVFEGITHHFSHVIQLLMNHCVCVCVCVCAHGNYKLVTAAIDISHIHMILSTVMLAWYP